MIKLCDFLSLFSDAYNICLYDESDNEELFNSKTDSKALNNYGDWIVKDVSFITSLLINGAYSGIKVYIRENK